MSYDDTNLSVMDQLDALRAEIAEIKAMMTSASETITQVMNEVTPLLEQVQSHPMLRMFTGGKK